MALNVINDLDFNDVIAKKETDSNQTQTPQFVCDICGKMYKHRYNLEAHIGIHNGSSLYSCEFCGKAFTQKISLKRHLPIHTQIPQYTCNICDKEFIHEKTYKRHMSNHTGLKAAYCPICNLGCDNNTELNRHLRCHTNEKPFSCDICGKCFNQRYNMYAHKRTIHEGSNGSSKSSFQKRCPLCDMVYERSKLAEHLSEYHTLVQSSMIT